MKLPSELVSIVCKGVLRELVQRRVVSTENQADTVSKMERILLSDLKRDEEFTKSAKAVLDARMVEIQAVRDLDFRALLSKAKRELASKENYVVWGGESKFSPDKSRQLARDFAEFFKREDQIEYFVKPDQLLRETLMALEKEAQRDRLREQRAAEKVRKIKRGVVEGSAEFAALYDQFYRESLQKEA